MSDHQKQQFQAVKMSEPWKFEINLMPWKSHNTSHNIMHFNATEKPNQKLHYQKRRSNEHEESNLPLKQFISEEKITAHFNGLHISNKYLTNNSTNDLSLVAALEEPSTSAKSLLNLHSEQQEQQGKEKDLEQILKNASRIVVCDELKKFHEEQKSASYLPESLLLRITKPSTELMLWQPPPSFVQNFMNSKSNKYNDKEDKKSTDEKVKKNENDFEFDDDSEFYDADLETEIDDFLDNNNTCCVDYNNLKPDRMDEDL